MTRKVLGILNHNTNEDNIILLNVVIIEMNVCDKAKELFIKSLDSLQQI